MYFCRNNVLIQKTNNKTIRKMKRIMMLCAFLFVTCTFISAQERTVDAVYLKNGSIIKGEVIELIPDSIIKVKTADGSLFVYPSTDVAKVTKEKSVNAYNRQYQKNNQERNTRYQSYPYKTRGYRGDVELSYLIGAGDYASDRVELTTSHGYQFNPYIYLGGGLGFQYWNDLEVFTMPIFTDFRVNFMKGKIIPNAGVKLGIAAELNDDAAAGGYFNPSVGVKFMLSRKNAINVSLGYTLQTLNRDYSYSSGGNYGYGGGYAYYYYDSGNFNSVNFKVGYEF